MESIVRQNIKKDPDYRPYCGNPDCHGRAWERVEKDGDQFKCPLCGWRSEFEEEFSDKYIKGK